MINYLRSNKKRVTIIGIILIVIIGFMLTIPLGLQRIGCHKTKLDHVDNVYDSICKHKHIRVITHNNSTSYFVYRGQPMGFHYDIVKRMAKEMGFTFEIIAEEDLQKAIDMLNNGEADLIAMDITHTKTRENNLNFTTSIGETRQVLVQRKKKQKDYPNTAYLRKTSDLEDKKIFIQKGTVFKEQLMHIKDMSALHFEVVEDLQHTMEELVMMVSNGQIDYTVCDERIAKANATYTSNIDLSLTLSNQQKLAWAVSKGADSLLIVVDNWLNHYKKTRHYKATKRKYFETKKNSFYTDQEHLPSRGGQLSPYDDLIKKYAKELGWDWRLLAAVIYQESHFNPQAESWAGAKGLMQLMPTPAKKFGVTDPFDPEQSIRAGVQYLKLLLNRFDSPEISPLDKIRFTLASYNIGYGHVMDARKLAEIGQSSPDIWNNGVDTFMILKSNPEYYNHKEVKYGYCRGQNAYNYVQKIFSLYNDYENLVN